MVCIFINFIWISLNIFTLVTDSAFDFCDFHFKNEKRFTSLNCSSFKHRKISVKNFFVFMLPSLFFSKLNVWLWNSKCLTRHVFLQVFKITFQKWVKEINKDFSCFLMKIIKIKRRIILFHNFCCLSTRWFVKNHSS